MLLKRIKEIIDRYLQGTNSPLEEHALKSWFDKLQHTDSSLDRERLDTICADMWQQIRDFEATPTKRSGKRHLLWASLAGAAAVLLAGFLIFSPTSSESGTVYATTSGESKEITLADGSVLLLGENSRVSLHPHFDQDSLRVVSLQYGEVFFDDAKDPQRPFIIQNRLMKTEVLGTSFTIRSNEDRRCWNIRVKSGQVRVSTTEQQKRSYLLLANDSLQYDQKNNTVRYSPSKVKDTGKLIFQDASMHTVVEKLAQHYQCFIQLAPGQQKLHHQFSGEFQENEPLDAVLDMICVATGMQYRQQGDTIMLSQKTNRK